jgi:hypothetical protein
LTETIVAPSTKIAKHHVVAITHVLGATEVPRLISEKLCFAERETAGIAIFVGADVVTPRVTKSSNISAANQASSSKVVAAKQMNDIGINARAADVCTKTPKQPVGFGTETVGASLNQER